MKKQKAGFWNDQRSEAPIERRVIWQFGNKRGELGISIAANQPVPDISRISEKMMETAVVDSGKLAPGEFVAPQFTFALVGQSSHGKDAVVFGPGHREIPVAQLPADVREEAENMRGRMDRTKAAMPPAQVVVGDHAVGFLARKDDILHFYPIAAVTVPEEIESYREGSGSTADLIHVLPFQS